MSESTITRRVGWVALVIAAFGATATMVGSAAAGGGSLWDFGDKAYRPGDVAEAVTAVAWDHDAVLGTPDDGPYLLYLARASNGWPSWPPDPNALPVGVVTVELGPFKGEDGDMYGPHAAIARLEIPRVDPGDYQVLHCNVPCTTPLGDIIGGRNLNVLDGTSGRATAEIAADIDAWLATDRATPPPPAAGDASGPGLRLPVIPVAVAAMAALLAVVSWLTVRRRPAALRLVVSEGTSPPTGEKTPA